jgi:hypothetical protein
MATPPLLCPSDIANGQIERVYFDRCTLLITQDNTIMNSMNFCDFSLNITDFYSMDVTLKGGFSFYLDDSNLGNKFQEVTFLLIKVKYGADFTTYTDKYIYFKFQENQYPIGELAIFTGNPSDNPGTGVILDANGSKYSSPQFSTGGFVIYNPHYNSVKLNILAAY